ncbi:hypothetical protein J8273_0329 [Carpediemonas membranifera]|uniref:C2 domain-containing protein n=1 Tax=Carpediemonas membranifera TaxID=201153 RepID=A0A8J6EAQ7_9EUKA|nr:hypothetical protein J8273_0329 [Carpediemonas membranifera]|eukprot:KAG9395110.1 hypothetical protein J8273_0329 [Carpediemonas membranifera]
MRGQVENGDRASWLQPILYRIPALSKNTSGELTDWQPAFADEVGVRRSRSVPPAQLPISLTIAKQRKKQTSDREINPLDTVGVQYSELEIIPLKVEFSRLPGLTPVQQLACDLHSEYKLYTARLLTLMSELTYAEDAVKVAQPVEDPTILAELQHATDQIRRIEQKLDVMRKICELKAGFERAWDRVDRLRANGTLSVSVYVTKTFDEDRVENFERRLLADIGVLQSRYVDILSHHTAGDDGEVGMLVRRVMAHLGLSVPSSGVVSNEDILAAVDETWRRDRFRSWALIFTSTDAPIASDGAVIPSLDNRRAGLRLFVNTEEVAVTPTRPVSWGHRGELPYAAWNDAVSLDVRSMPHVSVRLQLSTDHSVPFSKLVSRMTAYTSAPIPLMVPESNQTNTVEFSDAKVAGTLTYLVTWSGAPPTTLHPFVPTKAGPAPEDVDVLNPFNARRALTQADAVLKPAVQKRPRKGHHGAISVPATPRRDSVVETPATLAERVRQHALLQRYRKRRVPAIDTILTHQTPLDWASLRQQAMAWAGPRRPLFPVPRKREPARVPRSSALVVRVNKASDLPFRTGEGHVTPFVRVSTGMAEHMARTPTVVSVDRQAMWNEELRMECTAPPDGFTAEYCSALRSPIVISLFDELEIHDSSDTRLAETHVNLHYEPRFLGSVVVPAGMVVMNGCVSGTFELHVPTAFAGYGLQTVNKKLAVPKVELFVTFDPMLPFIEDNTAVGASKDSSELVEFAEKWADGLERRFPDRDFGPFNTDIEGFSVLACRYVAPLAPPPQLDSNIVDYVERLEMQAGDDNSARVVTTHPTEGQLKPRKDHNRLAHSGQAFYLASLVRYVSNVPFLEDASAFDGSVDLWLNAEQFMEVGAGDWEEHALLLQSYLLYVGRTAFIVQGHAIPEGDSSYVLLLDKDGGLSGAVLINACSGVIYDLTDEACPMVAVHTVFDHTNMWANTQDEARPWKLNWDLSSRRKWAPLFKSPEAAARLGFIPGSTVQPQSLSYELVDPRTRLTTTDLDGAARALEDEIQRAIMAEIAVWVSPNRTPVTAPGSALPYKNTLSLMESLKLRGELLNGVSFEKLVGTGRRKTEITRALASFFESVSRVCGAVVRSRVEAGETGFVLTLPWSDMESLLTAIKETCIHQVDPQTTAIRIVPYVRLFPNSVACVWVWTSSAPISGVDHATMLGRTGAW